MGGFGYQATGKAWSLARLGRGKQGKRIRFVRALTVNLIKINLNAKGKRLLKRKNSAMLKSSACRGRQQDAPMKC